MTFVLGLFLTFLTGSYYNEVTLEKHNENYHYYLHRGMPIVFSGVTIQDPTPSFPFITFPIFKETLTEDHKTYLKIMDFNRFLLAFGFYFLFSLIPASLLSTIKIQKKQYVALVIVSFISLAITIFLWGQVIV